MSTVWILSQGEGHEGGEVLGVFATRDLARGFVAEAANRLPFDLDGARQEPDGSVHLRAGCDWLALEPHEVIDRPQIAGGAS
ncbi:hypothetical protein [Streptomyces sp. SCSIO ZS0520]|uniref:hypothetical protein n=1 Tax=Streptomyces sp. SCSIO ZS0520 TaxID=2892996 RepID=UPI0021DA146F|nr:hypothetical protein [Streptomyces sp. SCSIO ZS0520]